MRDKKLTILVDMDDTIENLLVHWVAMLNELYGTSVDVENVRSWFLQEAFPELTQEQVYAPLKTDELWLRVTPKPDAQEYLKRLRDDGHEIFITTSSAYQTVPVKMERVLFRYFPGITWSQVILASTKQMIRGDVMVDDGPHNLEYGAYYKILMDAPHNRNYTPQAYGVCRPRIELASDGAKFLPGFDYTRLGNIIRTKNWAEVYRVITDLSHDLGALTA